ncbi:MAG TPA: LPXTG cell wall anchor domain-containing protein, partial [Ilumatobacteraceae bacterium]
MIVSRRKLLTCGVSGLVSVAVGARTATVSATALTTTVTMWRLDPDWGAPLTTDSGSSTKSRCRGGACHAAAPHRFFLTRADALAGRLHRCCLAQPVAIQVCIDLNALMPFYAARLGGVDGRCPSLPPDLRDALYGSSCTRPVLPQTEPLPTSAVVPTTVPATVPATTPATAPATTPVATTPVATEPDLAHATATELNSALPVTGTNVGSMIVTAGALVVIGGAAVAARQRKADAG